MKIAFFVLFLLCAAAAFGQTGAGVLSNQPQIVSFPDHPLHADHSSLACEHPLVGGGEGTYTYAHGELPLWEFGSPNPGPAPLGDVARAYRKQKIAARKAETVLEKQGS
jgi:hypothetical protein